MQQQECDGDTEIFDLKNLSIGNSDFMSNKHREVVIDFLMIQN